MKEKEQRIMNEAKPRNEEGELKYIDNKNFTGP